VTDSPDAIEGLTPDQITDLAKDGFNTITDNSGPLQIDVAQGLAILDAGLVVTADGQKLIDDTSADDASLTPAQVAGLESDGFIIGSGVTVGSDGSVTVDGELTGSGTVNGTLTVDPSGSVQVTSGTLDVASGSVVNNNQITVSGATLDLGTGVDLSGTGTVEVTDGSVEVDGSVSPGQTFVIDPSTITIGDPAAFFGTLDLSPGDELIIDGTNGGTYADGAFTVTENGVTVGMLEAPGHTSGDFSFTQGSGNTLDITVSTAPCYCRGTHILAVRGEVTVENLAIGDCVATRNGPRPIRWIGRRFYDGRFIRGNREVLPIKIAAGALAHGVPARDLWISPEHALYLDGVLVPARLLVNGMTITQADAVEQLEYFHVELDSHDVILAEGAAAETYIECDNRLMFHNAAEFGALYPDAPRSDSAVAFCAPRPEDGAAALAVIHARLLARAVALGHQVTGDPGLHLVVDGVAVEPLLVEDGVYRFRLDQPAGAIYLASRNTVPAETDAASTDRRRLGVCLRRITLRDADLALDLMPEHHLLRDGFHEPEGEHRWTVGMTRLPASVVDLFAGPIDIEIAVWPTQLRYAERAA
jgi:hypothetical protein